MDPVYLWIMAVLQALHTEALIANPEYDDDSLWEALERDVRPGLEELRPYVFFTLGSDPDSIEPTKVAKSLFLEMQRRDIKGREPTQPLYIPLDAREIPPDESPLPILPDPDDEKPL